MALAENDRKRGVIWLGVAGPVDAEGCGKIVWGAAVSPESVRHCPRQTERVASNASSGWLPGRRQERENHPDLRGGLG